ncbi:MAG: hypothetical protein ABSC06_05300 [Rhodopila sp.]|jgi:hypothetical protein
MGRRLTAGRELEIARQMALAAGDEMQEWLTKRVRIERNARLQCLIHAYYTLRPGMARSQPDEPATEQAQTADGVYEKALLELRAGWLLQHVLTPNAPDSLLEPAVAQKLRNFMLDKLRDRERRQNPKSLTMRLPGVTAEGMDSLAEARGLETRSAVLMALLGAALSQEMFGAGAARPAQGAPQSRAAVRNEIAGLVVAWDARNLWPLSGQIEPPTKVPRQRRSGNQSLR